MHDTNIYISLIPYASRTEKFSSWTRQLLKPLKDIQKCAEQLLSNFSVDKAVGVQLDMVGELVSLSRTLSFAPSDGHSRVMDDDTYRMALRAHILKNNFDGTLGALESAWNTLMPDVPLFIHDNQDMTIDVILYSQQDDFLFDLLKNGYIFPKIMGVSINYIFTGQRLFGYGRNAIIDGYDEGVWANRE